MTIYCFYGTILILIISHYSATPQQTKLVVSGLKENLPPMNPMNQKPWSDRFRQILKKRLLLPVWEYRDEFIKTCTDNQCVVLVGETGSGKTTQVEIMICYKIDFDTNYIEKSNKKIKFYFRQSGEVVSLRIRLLIFIIK